MYNDIPDHPVIANLLRTGYPDGKEPEYPHCPVCDAEEIDTVFVDKDLDIRGCDRCCSMIFPEDLAPEGMTTDEDSWYHCPVCGEPVEMFAIITKTKEIIGCDACVTRQDANEHSECFHNNE